ncbi:uncharacterized protein VTP21DRAFT_2502 [Calcarisporiella thermophila]|uniref:uncharacterized protein n=1 Tax=Calcarisporiella thermophila TaxID=911321 RepID=UPI00374218AA
MTEMEHLFRRLLYQFVGSCFYALFLFRAFLLVCKGHNPLPRVDRSKVRESLTSGELPYGKHRYITVNNKQFHVVEGGDPNGPLILFLHGFPQCWYTWRYQLEALKDEGFRLVAVDLRGYGGSFKPKHLRDYTLDLLIADIRDVIQFYGGEAHTIVSHDWGGILASMAGRDSWVRETSGEKGYMQRLVVCNAPALDLLGYNIRAPFGELKSLPNVIRFASDKAYRHALIQRMCIVLKQILLFFYVFIFSLPYPLPEFYATSFGSSMVRRANFHLRPEEVEPYLSALQSFGDLTPPINYYRNIVFPGDVLPQNEEKGKINPVGYKTMIIWGNKDFVLDSTMNLANISLKYPNLKLVQLEQERHFVQEENAETFTQLIREFIHTK